MADKVELGLGKAARTYVDEALGQGATLDAKHASDEEHAQTFWEAVKGNRKAVAWSMVISLSIVMEGYDTLLIGNFFGYPQFVRKFGHNYGGDVGWSLSAPWQTGLNMGSTSGTILGGMLNGWLCSRFGYRWVMIGGLVSMIGFIFIVFFASNLPVLLLGQILCGFSWGVFAIIGPAYASETCPTNLRGYLTTYVNMCWAVGQFIAGGVLQGLVGRQDEWGYRIPFALQWIWPVPIAVACFFAPESPWYLVRRDRLEEAKHSLRRLASGDRSEDQINGQLAMLVHTVKIESEMKEGTSYWDCFKGVDRRRTEICCMAFAGQILSGSTFAYSPSYFFTTAGLSPDDAYKLNLGGTAIAFVGVILSWWLITYVGRRTLYLSGQGILIVLLFLIGILNAAAFKRTLYAQAAFCVLWLFVYSMTVGPVAYAIVAETSSVRLRSLTVSLARVSYQTVNIISQVLENYFMNPTAWNASGKTGFFWGGTALLAFTWAFFRLPEGKGRTYEEMDILFARRVSARKFASTHADAYADVAEGGLDKHELTPDKKDRS